MGIFKREISPCKAETKNTQLNRGFHVGFGTEQEITLAHDMKYFYNSWKDNT